MFSRPEKKLKNLFKNFRFVLKQETMHPAGHTTFFKMSQRTGCTARWLRSLLVASALTFADCSQFFVSDVEMRIGLDIVTFHEELHSRFSNRGKSIDYWRRSCAGRAVRPAVTTTVPPAALGAILKSGSPSQVAARLAA